MPAFPRVIREGRLHVSRKDFLIHEAMPLLGFYSAASSSGLGLFSTLQRSVAASASSADGKVMGQGPFGIKYYLQGALAGGICCGVTHGALTPVDVVKTRIQLDPAKYNQGFIGGFKQVIEAEGAGALLTGLGPTAQGYFIQGWFKFGGVEFFKINFTNYLGEQTAWDNRTSIYLVASACAECIADIFLCPCAPPPPTAPARPPRPRTTTAPLGVRRSDRVPWNAPPCPKIP
jgi:hypothetical protein